MKGNEEKKEHERTKEQIECTLNRHLTWPCNFFLLLHQFIPLRIPKNVEMKSVGLHGNVNHGFTVHMNSMRDYFAAASTLLFYIESHWIWVCSKNIFGTVIAIAFISIIIIVLQVVLIHLQSFHHKL